MLRIGKAFALFSVLVAVSATAVAASPLPGTWRKLPAAPFAVHQSLTSVWTGRRLIVFGRNPAMNPSVDVAEAYDPAAKTWTKLSPPAAPDYVPGYDAVWTGEEMLAFGAFHSVAYKPATNAWRVLRKSIPGGIVVWTGREAIGWGGGCCGDAQSNGAAYNPATNTFRNLAHSPLAASQHPAGAWTGRELVLFVSGLSPDGKPYPARLARAAAYNPATNTWRRLAAMPAQGGVSVWNGRELLVVGGGARGRLAFAYKPSTNHWRKLASLSAGRFGTAVWAGKRLLLWGGQKLGASGNLNDGLAYDPRTNRWSAIPRSPLRARGGSTVAWTGRALFVWSGKAAATLELAR